MAGLADEGESHGSLGHGKLAVSIPRRRPSELPQLLGDGEEQGHGHQAGGQRGQSRDQVERVEQHGDGEPGVSLSLSGALGGVQKDGRELRKKKKNLYICVNLSDGKVCVQLNLDLRKSAARLRATDDSQRELTYRKKLKPTQSCFCVR